MTPQGNMHSNTVWGTFTIGHGDEAEDISVLVFDTNPITLQQTESGDLTVLQDWRNNRRSPNGVRPISCGEDYYVGYYWVHRNKVFSNALRVNTYNPVDWNIIAIVQEGRLHGRYYCHGDYCTVSLCFSDHANEPWALQLCWN